jgi:hypothetical protein
MCDKKTRYAGKIRAGMKSPPGAGSSSSKNTPAAAFLTTFAPFA